MAAQVCDRTQLYEAAKLLLELMEEELERELLSLDFCDAWGDFEEILNDLQVEIESD